jgi:hypothetical protein
VEGFREEVRAADEKEVVVLAAMTCSGFLSFLEDSAIELRKAIDEWRKTPQRARNEGEARGREAK